MTEASVNAMHCLMSFLELGIPEQDRFPSKKDSYVQIESLRLIRINNLLNDLFDRLCFEDLVYIEINSKFSKKYRTGQQLGLLQLTM